MGNICKSDSNDDNMYCDICKQQWNFKFIQHCEICCTNYKYNDFHCCDCKHVESMSKYTQSKKGEFDHCCDCEKHIKHDYCVNAQYFNAMQKINKTRRRISL